MKKEKHKILTPLVSLDTPGKATVEVVILADPVRIYYVMLLRLNVEYLPNVRLSDSDLHIMQDGHEICFVGDEAFRQLSAMDPKGNELLDEVISLSILSCDPLTSRIHVFSVWFLSQAMAADKSDEWFAKHNKQKASA